MSAFSLSLRGIALALGGEVVGDQVSAPGPNHSPKDRSLSVKLSATAPEGFVAFSHSGDDWQLCRDHVRQRLGIEPDNWKQRERPKTLAPKREGDDSAKVAWLWRQRKPVMGSIAETYLRKARGYGGPIPSSLGFLPSRRDHAPALIAAFGLCDEPEPGLLRLPDAAVKAVQLVKLKADGSGKADIDPNKVIIGRGALGSPIVLAPPNDGLGLAICEGVEDALSVFEATGLGAWAAGPAGRMPALALAVPAWVECVTIFGHDDPPGRPKAIELASRLRRLGFEAILKFLSRRVAS